MSRTATVFWSLLLGGSVVAIGAGFVSGQHVGEHALPPPPRHGNEPLPAPIEPRTTVRLLHGAGSFDPGDADPDPYGDADAAVAARPEGWRAPADGGVPRVAVVVVGGERDASALDALLAEPVPLTVVVSPSDAHDALRAVREAGKTALVACQSVDLATLVSLRRAGAAGIACSTGDASRARALVVADRGGMVFDDRDHDDALYRAARAAHVPAVSRDVVVDAREERAYVDFLFDQALAIARRTGAATAVVHARPSSIPALQRFERHAQRAGVDLVDLRSLAP
ncbi:MAG TPA: divergent polysaccharide deacetylase family protein [Candidatus Sulfotelmatobacter sp.]|nr:divergent polysaccharide deacetylase family protein [Candidatus Sulfotelmatobacter sp.]